VHPILDETFFETHMVDVSRSACSEVVMCHDGKELSLKLRKTPMIGIAKLNLVSLDQMMVVVRLEQLQ
jgi:hypothetical protein